MSELRHRYCHPTRSVGIRNAAIGETSERLRVRTGSALVEHKISASPPKPDICALMSTRSNCGPAQTLKCSSGINGIAYTFFFEYPLFLLVPAKH